MKIINILLCALVVSCSPASDKFYPTEKQEQFNDTHDTFDPSVDILFVIDNSASMRVHQTNLAKNIKLFVSKIQQVKLLQFNIGVTSTDISDNGKLLGYPNYVDQNTPRLNYVLYDNLIIGIDGSPEEKPLDSTYLALSQPNLGGVNAGFYRDGADLAIVFLTDAEDQSEHYVRRPKILSDYLLSLKKGLSSKIHIYSAYIPSNEKYCERDDPWTSPRRLEEFFALTKAITFSLCDSAFGLKIADIGDNLVSKIVNIIRLSRLPIPQTIKVTFGAQIIPNDPNTGWVYDPEENAIVLGDELVLTVQPPGTKVVVSFTIAGEQ